MAGKQYETNDEVMSAVEDFIESQEESFYTTGIQALQHQWKKYVDRRGDYMLKINHIWSNSTIAFFQPTLVLISNHYNLVFSNHYFDKKLLYKFKVPKWIYASNIWYLLAD